MFDRKPKKEDSPKQPTATNARKVVGGPPESHAEAGPSQGSLPSTPRKKSETTTLGPNVVVKGNLMFTGTLIVNCKVLGTISKGERLIVGSTGQVAAVQAQVVEITGMVQGDIKAGQSVKIFSGAVVDGDIETPTISMEEGVSFQGRCTRPPEPPKTEQDASEQNQTEKVLAEAPASEVVEPLPESPDSESPTDS